MIVRAVSGLDDVVSVSFVDADRDGRGWAFRPRTGPDTANGFTLLRDAYEATESGFDGHVSVPVLWDRELRRIVSNDPVTIEHDLNIAFRDLVTPTVDLYPEGAEHELRALDELVRHGVIDNIATAASNPRARRGLLVALDTIDRRLEHRRHLLGDRLTIVDVRLFAALVRFDTGANADRSIIGGLEQYPSLWASSRALFALDGFGSTTEFAAFAAPDAWVLGWTQASERTATRLAS